MRATGYTFLVATALMWASNGVTSRLAFDGGIAPRDLAAIRIFGSAILFGLGTIVVLRRLTGRELLLLVVFGCVGITLAQYLYYEAIDRIDVAVALVIVYINPILVAIWQRAVHGERLRRLAQVAMLVAIGGVVLMVVGRSGGLGGISLLGLVFAFGTAVAAAAQALLAGRLPRSLSAIQRTGAAMLAASAVWLVANPVWTIPWGSLGGEAGLGPRIDTTVPLLVIVAWVTVVGTALPYVGLVAGTSRVGPGAASVTTMIEPVVAAVLAWILLAQSLEPLQIVGICAALVGVVTVEVTRPSPVVGAVGD